MKYLFVGGSFDPIHNGHLTAAREAGEFIVADKVILVPSAMKAHKGGKTAYAHRYAMCDLAIKGDKYFGVSDVEQFVCKAQGDSYTCDVIAEIQRRIGNGERVNWMIGSDSIPKAVKWKNQSALQKLAHFIVADRPGYPLDIGPLTKSGHQFTIAQTTVNEISSTLIRVRARARKPIRYLVPDAVDGYILSNHLYASG